MKSFSEGWRVLVRANEAAFGRNRYSLMPGLLAISDVVVGVLFASWAEALYVHLELTKSMALQTSVGYRGAALAVAVIAGLALSDASVESSIARADIGALIGRYSARFLKVVLVIAAVSVAGLTLWQPPALLVLLWFVMAGAGMLGSRMMLSIVWRALRHRGVAVQTIAIVGTGPVADRVIRQLMQTSNRAVQLVGVFDDRTRRCAGSTFVRTGSVAELLEAGKTRPIDWVLITFPESAEKPLLALTHTLKSLSVPVGLCPQTFGIGSQPAAFVDVGVGLTVTMLADRALGRWSALIKTAEDLILGGLITLLVSPLLLLIALAIALDSPGPIIFRQKRHAENNAEFDVFKFRTMRWQPDADARNVQQTLRGDPRITRVGRFLRKSSLDELPQLFNVLRGEMSLVGPRPHAVNMRTEERLCHEISARYPHRHRVKPGITGWSQVNGSRGAVTTTEQLVRRLELDLYYIENWSLRFDLWILLRTIWVVVRTTNAH